MRRRWRTPLLPLPLLLMVAVLGDEGYPYPQPLARSILGPGAVYMPPWPSQEGVYTAPGPRMGLASGSGYV